MYQENEGKNKSKFFRVSIVIATLSLLLTIFFVHAETSWIRNRKNPVFSCSSLLTFNFDERKKSCLGSLIENKNNAQCNSQA